MSAVDISKVLCHADGSLFCNYHPDARDNGYVHAIYLCNEAVAPDPATLGIVTSSVTDVSTLVWFEIEAYVRPIPRAPEQVAGAFDFDAAEYVAW
jgi:hypothetical protein